VPADLPDEDVCLLSTRGRRTGRTHTIEIWYARAADGATLYLLAGGGERADWVRNLRAEPAVTVRIGGRTWPATARVVTDPEERGRGAHLVHAKYQPGYGGDLTRWRDSATLVAVTVTVTVADP
jgi:deazaflavin-dependent oxidoreductase (nitroreductase family)